MMRLTVAWVRSRVDAAGAVGDRDERRRQRRQPRDRLPQRLFHLLGLRRKKLEGDPHAGRRAGRKAAGAGLGQRVHQATSRRLAMRKARIVGKPQRHRDLALGSRLRGHAGVDRAFEAGLLHPLDHRLGGKAEPAVGMLLAQELEIVGCEVDTRSRPLRTQHPRRLADRAAAVIEEVQHLVHDHDVEGIPRQREVKNIALADAAIFDAGTVEPAARQRQHVEVEIDADAALDLGREQFQNAPGAGAEVEQRPERPVEQQPCGFPLRRRHRAACRRADAIPLRGMAPEIILRRLNPVAPHVVEPLAVAHDDRHPPDRARAISRCTTAAAGPCSARRKNAHAPSRKRSTSPASVNSLR